MLYSSRDNYKTILFVVLSMTIIYYFLTMSGVINTDVFDSYEQRNLATNSSAESAGGRMGLWEQSLTNLINYPWGWSKYNDFYCHNMWLDIARCAGWIPFIIIVAFTFKHLVIIFKLFRIRNDWFIGFLIGINGCLILSSFVEPVLELSSTYFCIICLVWGVQQQYYCQIKRNLQNDYNYKLLGNYVKSDIYS